MLTPEDIEKLVVAVESLYREPWLDIAIPTVAGTVGVVVGYLLSLLGSKAARDADRKERIRDEVRARRIAAVSAVSLELKWMAENIRFAGRDEELASHLRARTMGPEMFNLTGELRDETLSYAYSHFFKELADSIGSFARRRGTLTSHPNLTHEHVEFFRTQVSRVRSAAQQWINDEIDEVKFVRVVVSSSELMKSRRDQAEAL